MPRIARSVLESAFIRCSSAKLVTTISETFPVDKSPNKGVTLANMVRAIHHAARVSQRTLPLFALTAVLTIGLGIGASAAIYSVAHAVLLRPLPYKDPARLLIAQLRDDVKTRCRGLSHFHA